MSIEIEIPTPESVIDLQRKALQPRAEIIITALIREMEKGPSAYYSVKVADYDAALLAAQQFESKGWSAKVGDQREGMYIQVTPRRK